MAYINLTGDSDGDLHTAAMHNAKFGAISSVLNGNITADNLTAPDSIVTWSFSAQPAHNIGANSFTQSGGYLDVTYPASNYLTSIVAGGSNYIVSSLWKTDRQYTFVGFNMIIIRSPGYNIGDDDFTVRLQTHDDVTEVAPSSWTTLATATFEPHYARCFPLDVPLSVTAAVDASRYIRVVIDNPASTWVGVKYPPIVSGRMTLKTRHV